MSEPFIGEIRIWTNNFAPRGWSYCDGQTLPIAQNTALFSLLGTTYGGDGRSTFALPDLMGRAPLHVGGTTAQGPGLSPYSLGERTGTSTVVLDQTQLPSHNHALKGDREFGNSATPSGYIAVDRDTSSKEYAAQTNPLNVTLSSGQLDNSGGNQAHNNMQPYLALGFCIALIGIFPQRS